MCAAAKKSLWCLPASTLQCMYVTFAPSCVHVSKELQRLVFPFPVPSRTLATSYHHSGLERACNHPCMPTTSHPIPLSEESVEQRGDPTREKGPEMWWTLSFSSLIKCRHGKTGRITRMGTRAISWPRVSGPRQLIRAKDRRRSCVVKSILAVFSASKEMETVGITIHDCDVFRLVGDRVMVFFFFFLFFFYVLLFILCGVYFRSLLGLVLHPPSIHTLQLVNTVCCS